MKSIIDNKIVWCIKTHYPERLGYKRFLFNKSIVLIRNPFDCINSYFNMILTQTHTLSIKDDEYIKYSKIFNELIKIESKVWSEFHKQWLQLNNNNNIPILFIRYEDLIQHRKLTLNKNIKIFIFQ